LPRTTERPAESDEKAGPGKGRIGGQAWTWSTHPKVNESKTVSIIRTGKGKSKGDMRPRLSTQSAPTASRSTIFSFNYSLPNACIQCCAWMNIKNRGDSPVVFENVKMS
jgi:hypothetical protein